MSAVMTQLDFILKSDLRIVRRIRTQRFSFLKRAIHTESDQQRDTKTLLLLSQLTHSITNIKSPLKDNVL